MKVTFLGTGTSQGVPVIACSCAVCASKDNVDKRLRSSVLVETAKNALVIDTGPDFRYQMLRENVQNVNAYLMTHEHKDHIAGLDDVRAFNFKHNRDAQVYATLQVQKAIKRDFHYAFSDDPYPGIPRINLNSIENKPFDVGGDMIVPILVWHHKMPVFGFRIQDFTYITDIKTIDESEKAKIKGSKVLVLSALRKGKHVSHLTLDEALALAMELEVPKTYLTHISHLMGKHEKVKQELPENVQLAYDKLTIELE